MYRGFIFKPLLFLMSLYKGKVPGSKTTPPLVEETPTRADNRRVEELERLLKAEKQVSKTLMVLNAELRDLFRHENPEIYSRMVRAVQNTHRNS